MKFKTYFSFLTIASLILLSSCEEDINIGSVSIGEDKIVIEGNIENGKTAEVIITRNSPITKTVDFAAILIKDAKVYVSNGLIIDTLHLDTVYTSAIPYVYVGSSIVGVPGQNYFLTVIVDGKKYTSITTIPAPVALDSVWWKPQKVDDSLGYAWAHLKEPVGPGNAYRWFSKKPTKYGLFNGKIIPYLNRRFVAPMGASFDDKFVDGEEFDFFYNRPEDPTESTFTIDESEKEKRFYKQKDTVYIKFCSLDYSAAKFYTTYDQALENNGNPFASPSYIISNINGGGLGVWAGMGVTYDTIMPKP